MVKQQDLLATGESGTSKDVQKPAQIRRKILMTAFHFPPQAGSSGVLRTLNFVRYLPESGWDPIVLTVRPDAYEETRTDLLNGIPDNVEVIRPRALDAARHLSICKKYLMLTAIPDRWSTWWISAVQLGKRIIASRHPDVLWSTYPISTAHLIALSLAKWSGLPWVADFRDPMVTVDFPNNWLLRLVWRWLEARVFREASLCVFTAEGAADLYRARYPAAASRCHVIENGYDENLFSGLAATRSGVSRDTILMLHSGIIYPDGRNPEAFFFSIAGLIRSGALDGEKLSIRFRAPVHSNAILALAEKHGLRSVVDIAPAIPYAEALSEMMGADLLLVFQGTTFNNQVPAKIYEYIRSSRPILALTDPSGNTAKTLRKFRECYIADIKLSDAISSALRFWLNARTQMNHQNQLTENITLVRGYSRQSQARSLAKLLQESLTQD